MNTTMKAFALVSIVDLQNLGWLWWAAVTLAAMLAMLIFLWLTVRYIPNNQAGVVERLWSPRGSVSEGRMIALHGEAGYQADLLRGGLHFGLYRWEYRIHRTPLVTVSQGKIGYVYARDGESLPPVRWPDRWIATISRTPAPSWAMCAIRIAPWGSAAASAISSARACMP